MIVYLSGCYTNGNTEENIAAARKVAIELWEKKYTVLAPHLNTAHFEKDCKCEYEDYLRGDFELIARCDAVIMLQGWNLSGGSTRERKYAEQLGVPVYYYPTLPPQRERMTDAQEAHLARIVGRFTRDVTEKYFRGQIEHGGDLFRKPNFPMLMQEVQDQVVYAYTLADQLEEVTQFCEIGIPSSAFNILTTGNAQGKIIKDIDAE